ncbi:NAD(P)/FAD-dependent oxidoreductase [Elioraea sp.]|uniref:FAD/NAD(P)-dependent oxidoreductase n=1 Tax=Elioraea sp. TaxID=2185103 RepID=UPI0025C46385|nr:NAD(P)/FAD-dependent oxidoreductase [Elioraea sp.]
MKVDLAVLGAGPAGANAALAAAGHGLSVAVIDENAAAGGQVWRAPAPSVTRDDADARDGAALREKLRISTVEHLDSATAWLIARDDAWRVDVARHGRSETVTADALVIATGAHERVMPFPGWTLPGVIGLAAATILLKANGVLPGQRTVVAGCGPLLSLVAASILKAGGTVAAVVDLASRAEWLGALPALAARPDLLARGALWRARIAAARVPVFHRHTVIRAEGTERLGAVRLGRVDAEGRLVPGAPEVAIAADALAIGHGLVPDTAATRLLRLRHRYDAASGWVAARDGTLAGSVARLWLAGEVGGIGGAAVAALQGRLAGLAAAQALGRSAAAAEAAQLQAGIARAGRAAAAMSWMMRPRPAMAGGITPETIVCRCEDVPRAAIEAAIAAGARDLNQVKQWTRCGMGPCQGRMCGEAAASLLAPHVGGRENVAPWTGRPPLRPVSADDLLGDFDYADIPIPAPAPP